MPHNNSQAGWKKTMKTHNSVDACVFPNLFSQLNLFLLEFANIFSATNSNSQKEEQTKWIGLSFTLHHFPQLTWHHMASYGIRLYSPIIFPNSSCFVELHREFSQISVQTSSNNGRWILDDFSRFAPTSLTETLVDRYIRAITKTHGIL